MTNDSTPSDTQAPSGKDNTAATDHGERERPPALPLVVIGASAGGLEPLKAFLRAVPADSGFAYVIVQHRPRNADNLLTDLMAQATALPVCTVEQGLSPLADHVYVAPPGRYMAVRQGCFEITEDTAAPHLPVDYLLRSVVQEQDLDPMAVILSGTGTDGTLGVKAVKAHDGIAAAQDPAEAEYRSMPDSAIETGEVDLVLPAASIAARLIEFQWHRRALGAEPRVSTPDELNRVFALLRERSGHDFSQYKRSTVMRRLNRRMAVNNMADLADYGRLLRNNPEEQDTLFREMLIRVSGFFRDPQAFASLERNVMPDLAARAASAEDRGIRVWVPGCATGEEAYSLGILLDEAMQARGSRAQVQIFATDIDPEAIALARAGRYSQSIALDVSQARLARYFETDGNYYRVRDELREMVVFAEQSVLRDPPFSSIDLLSCRNLLIYLETDVQSRLLPVFHYALAPGGYLFLGSSEGLADGGELFHPLDADARIFSRVDGARGVNTALVPPRHRGGGRDGARPPAAADSNRSSRDIVTVAEGVLLRDHVPACVVVDDDDRILYFRGRTSRFLEPATGAATLNIRQMIRGDLARALRDVMRRARRGDETAISAPLNEPDSDGALIVRLRASPVHESGVRGGSLLVAFELLPPWANAPVPDRSADDDEQVRHLEQELEETREDLRATVEDLETSNQELKAANEDLQSSNEELQSGNEELETSREELQSVNEELYTVNSELERKVEELSQAQDDINNLLASTDIGLIFVDREQRIMRFTPAVRRIVPLLDTDRGRPLSDFSATIGSPDLNAVLSEVLRTGADREQALQGSDGSWYLMRARPYLASQSRVSGVVLAFVDMALTHSHGTWLTALLNLSPAPVAVTDLEGGIARANRRLAALSGYDPQRLAELGLTELLAGMGTPEWQAMRATLLDARIWHGDCRLCHRDGSQIPVTVTFAPLLGPNDTVSEALVHITPTPP